MRGALPIAAALAAVASGGLAAAEPLPELQMATPSGWAHAAPVTGEGDVYLAPNPGGADLVIYPFRSFRGAREDFQRQFRSTLLKELVSARRREDSLAAAPQIQAMAVRGADNAAAAFFVGQRGPTQFVGVRLAVLAEGALAVIDFNASSAEAFQRHWPTVLQALGALAVGQPQEAQAADAHAAAGALRPDLYLAQGRLHYKQHVDWTGRTGGSWYNDVDTEWYLISSDGRVHHGWGLPSAPGGDIRRFDYTAAQRNDPSNAGVISVVGGRILITFKIRPEVLEAHQLANGDLEVGKIVYKRAGGK